MLRNGELCGGGGRGREGGGGVKLWGGGGVKLWGGGVSYGIQQFSFLDFTITAVFKNPS